MSATAVLGTGYGDGDGNGNGYGYGYGNGCLLYTSSSDRQKNMANI